MKHKKAIITARYALLAFAFAVLSVGCGSGFHVDPPDVTAISLKGEFCSAEKMSQTSPVKIQILVDVSGSMLSTDPAIDDPQNPGTEITMRQIGVREVIQRYSEDSNISFSIIKFNHNITPLTSGFTRDEDELDTAVAQLFQPTGNTHTKDAVDEARTVILNDVQNVVADADLTSRTRYINLLFSDGIPYYTSDSNPTDFDAVVMTELLQAVDQLMNMEDEYNIGDIKLYTALLGEESQFAGYSARYGFDASEAYNAAINLMQSVAEHGDASFTHFQEAADIDFLDIVSTSVTSPFEMSDVLVLNLNTKVIEQTSGVLRGIILAADSDGDGLADPEEPALGTSPTNRDSDNDKIGDGLEVRIGSDPNIADHDCELDDMDTDSDGLKDCEELVIGSNRFDPDTDDDLYPDSEILFGMNPLDPNDVSGDLDGDGLTNGYELKHGLNPMFDESTNREKYEYTYDWVYTRTNNAGFLCFEITVGNIGISETFKSDGQKPTNRILVNVFQEPSLGADVDNLISVGFIDLETDNAREIEEVYELPTNFEDF